MPLRTGVDSYGEEYEMHGGTVQEAEAPPTMLFPRINMYDGLHVLKEESAESRVLLAIDEDTFDINPTQRSPAHGLFPPADPFSRSRKNSFASSKVLDEENVNMDDYYQFHRFHSTTSSHAGPRTPSSVLDLYDTKQIDAVSIVDDAGSSICIDDDDSSIDVRDALKVLKKGKNKLGFGSANRTNDVTDFEEYNERVAREFILQDKAKKTQKKKVRRRPFVYDSRQYGNYFSVNNGNQANVSSNSSTLHSAVPNAAAITHSYEFDNFNGGRQNKRYNHQLNVLNSKYTYEEQQRLRRKRDNEIKDGTFFTGAEGASAVSREDDGLSFMTMNVDELDGHEDEDDYMSGDESPEPHVKRGLLSRQIQLMSLTGSLSVGLLLNSGYTLYSCGPFGTLLGYLITGFMCVCTMASFGEMISLIPADGTIANLVARFVDDSLGFTVGLTYWFCCAIGSPAEITAAAIMLSYYPILNIVERTYIVWITLFILIVLIVSLMDVRAWGELQYIACFITLIFFSMLLIVFCALNNGKIGPFYDKLGFRYWDHSKSNETTGEIYGLFRPAFNSYSYLVVNYLKDSEGVPVEYFHGIGGNIGRFMQFWQAVCGTFYSYVGTEVVFSTAAEVRNPRKALPAATRKIFWRISIFYILAVFLVSINVYAGDDRLVIGAAATTHEHPGSSSIAQRAEVLASASDDLERCVNEFFLSNSDYSGSIQGPNSSPWIMALKDAGVCGLANAVNAFFIFFSLTSACSRLYAASRTLYGVGQQNKYLAVFKRCTYYGIPYVAVLFSWLFCLLGYLTSHYRSDAVFSWLAGLTTSSALLVWAAMNLSFIRFFHGLKLRPDIFGRNDISYPYRSPFQPYTAFFGLISCVTLSFFLGALLFVNQNWDVRRFITDYLPTALFCLCYTTHKWMTGSKLVPLDQLDLDSCRKTIENTPWKEDRVYRTSIKELFKKYCSRFRNLRGSFKYHEDV